MLAEHLAHSHHRLSLHNFLHTRKFQWTFFVFANSELKCMKNAITADVQNDFSWNYARINSVTADIGQCEAGIVNKSPIVSKWVDCWVEWREKFIKINYLSISARLCESVNSRSRPHRTISENGKRSIKWALFLLCALIRGEPRKKRTKNVFWISKTNQQHSETTCFWHTPQAQKHSFCGFFSR